jgi:hypothetical protein
MFYSVELNCSGISSCTSIEISGIGKSAQCKFSKNLFQNAVKSSLIFV